MLVALEFLLVDKPLARRCDLVLRLDMRRLGTIRLGIDITSTTATKLSSDPADLQPRRKTFEVALLLVGEINWERIDLHGARRSSAGHLGGINERDMTAGNQIGASGAGLKIPANGPPASLLRKSILDVGQLASATAGCTAAYKLRARPRRENSLVPADLSGCPPATWQRG